MLNNFDSLHNISPGKHFYQFYKNTEDYLQVMLSYFRAGLKEGDACLWLISEKMGINFAKIFLQLHMDEFDAQIGSAQFQILSAEEWYLENDSFHEAKAAENAGSYLEMVKKMGFKRLRGAGDAGAIPREDWEKLENYERRMDAFIKTTPIIALCAYPILECTLKETRMVIDCHDDVLIGHF